jgi:transcriptional regulator with XRE-family HTH domain
MMASNSASEIALPREARSKLQKSQFAERLRAIMEHQGLTIAETARRVRQQLPNGEGFDDTNLIHYRQGRSLPRPGHLEALGRALGVSASDLLGTEMSAKLSGAKQRGTVARLRHSPQPENIEAKHAAPMIQAMEEYGENVLLRIEQFVPWPVAMRILQLLKDPHGATP